LLDTFVFNDCLSLMFLISSHFGFLMLPKGEKNELRNQEIHFRKIRNNLQKKGGVFVYTILISGVIIIKKGEIVEAKLQELFWWCEGISKIIKDEFLGWRNQDVKQKQRSQDKN